MAFTYELEGKIQGAYFNILKNNNLGKTGKTLTCGSYRKIAEEVKAEVNEWENRGVQPLEVANHIIFRILLCKFFVYENHQMATLIGYIYLVERGVEIRNYSINGINNNSTLDDIKALTASW